MTQINFMYLIGDKCSYCSKKATYFWFRKTAFGSIKMKWLCENHRLDACSGVLQ